MNRVTRGRPSAPKAANRTVFRAVPRTVPGAVFAAFVGGGLLAGCTLHHQGHMNAALASLNTAAADLGQATPDKAGHIAAALKDTQAAIDEVEAGMAYKVQAGGTATSD